MSPVNIVNYYETANRNERFIKFIRVEDIPNAGFRYHLNYFSYVRVFPTVDCILLISRSKNIFSIATVAHACVKQTQTRYSVLTIRTRT